MKGISRSLPAVIFLAFLTTGMLLFSSGPVNSAETAESAPLSSNAEAMMAELSDEQVRQLLIEELRKDAAVTEGDPQHMKGPAFFLARLLSIMTRGHDDNTDEVRALFGAFSTMGPDLYRVFVKL